MNTKTNNINNLDSSLNTTRKPLAKAIETALDSYKNNVASLISNLDLSEDDWFKTEYNLAKNHFNLSQEKIKKLKEDYREPLTLAWVMDSAEDFFTIKLAA